MASTLTISLDLHDSLLVARVRGSADELAEGERIVDAVHAEGARAGAARILVDFGALRGAMAAEYQLELEQYTAARLAGAKCALVLPPDCVADRAPPGDRSRFAVFGGVEEAFGWLQARRGATPVAAPTARPAHTLVHLL